VALSPFGFFVALSRQSGESAGPLQPHQRSKRRLIDEIKPAKKPKGLQGHASPLSRAGFVLVRSATSLGSGGVLADEWVSQTCNHRAPAGVEGGEEGQQLKVLIVAPTSVVTNWVREIRALRSVADHGVVHGAGRRETDQPTGEREHHHHQLRAVAARHRPIEEARVDYAILDEAQNIKNPLSATAAGSQRARRQTPPRTHRHAIENRLSEIWSIFEFVSPGLSGPAKVRGKNSPAPSTTAIRSKPRGCRRDSSVILRRTKNEGAKDLPRRSKSTKSSIWLPIKRPSTCRCCARCARRSWARSSARRRQEPTSHPGGLTKLRQAACDPRLL